MKIYLLIFLQLIIFSIANAQILKDWELFGGLNINNQTLLMRNEPRNTSPIFGWQVGITKNIHLLDYLKWEVSGGYTTNGSAYTVENFPGYKQNKRIDLYYGYIETGFKLIKEKNKFDFFGGAAFRGGVLINDKVNDTFYNNVHEKLDYGLNFKIGLGCKLDKVTPFLQISHYSGLANITRSSFFVGQPPVLIKNEMFNRSLSIQGGIRF